MSPYENEREPPEGYSHEPEAPFEEQVANWFRAVYGDENVQQQRYQPGPRWFCDIFVDTGHIRLFIEVESRASEVRPGLAQALGYAAEDPAYGVPMVIAPVGHLPIDTERLSRLRQSSVVPILTFDPERGIFHDEATSQRDEPESDSESELETDAEDEQAATPPESERWKPARKIPVEVDYKGPYYTTQVVDTLEGNFEIDKEYAREGYVLIRGVEGEIYPCRFDIFKDTYKYAP